jgi:hypothetical protein
VLQACGGGTGDVGARIVADVQDFVGGQAEPLAGFVEQARIRLGRAVLARARAEHEQRGDADRAEVGIAVGQAGHRQARGDALQAGFGIGIEIHPVAFAEEDRVRRGGQRGVVAAFLQRALDGQPAQQAQVVRVCGELARTPARAGARISLIGKRSAVLGLWRRTSRAGRFRCARRSVRRATGCRRGRG